MAYSNGPDSPENEDSPLDILWELGMYPFGPLIEVEASF